MPTYGWWEQKEPLLGYVLLQMGICRSRELLSLLVAGHNRIAAWYGSAMDKMMPTIPEQSLSLRMLFFTVQLSLACGTMRAVQGRCQPLGVC